MNVLTSAAQSYMTTFTGYQNQFLQWGQWIFFSLLTINIVWLSLWYAFDKHSLSESMPDFIKRFFIISLFYTIMLHVSWLSDVLKTAQFMGSTLTHAPIDPSSLISEGIGIGNKILIPVQKTSLLTSPFGVIIISVLYIGILYVFIRISVDLALTLIVTSALISIAAFFLGFAALGATSQIARQTLDVILGNCVKLLGIYLVVAAGGQTITTIASSIPTDLSNFEPYCWIAAVIGLFYGLARTLPEQLARMVSGAIHEHHGVDVVALAMTASRYAQVATPVLGLAKSGAEGIAKIVGSTTYNAGAHFNKASSSARSVGSGVGAAAVGSSIDMGKAVAGNVSDHFKNVSNKIAGGPGAQQPIKGISERMYNSAKNLNKS